MLTQSHLQSLTQEAVHAAREAGQIINTHRGTAIEVQHKVGGSSQAAQVVTEVDHKAQAAIVKHLEPLCTEFDLALLTEESPDDQQRQQQPAFWSIDPMDGTLNFIQGQAGFSVSIALVAQDGTPLLGVVFDPVKKDLYQATRQGGAFKNGEALVVPAVNPQHPLVLRTDISFQSDPLLPLTQLGLEKIAAQLGWNGVEVRYRTGAVLNACEILEQPNLCYFKFPKPKGGSLWDYAATACLYQEAHAVACDIYGQPMQLNRPDSTFMNHRGILYAASTELAQRILSWYPSLPQRSTGTVRA